MRDRRILYALLGIVLLSMLAPIVAQALPARVVLCEGFGRPG